MIRYLLFSCPGPPSGSYSITNTVTWLNSTSFTLKWTRPPHDGGDPDLRYDVEYSKEATEGNYVHWNSRKNIIAQEYNVTGLESGAKYEFRVFVSNIAGRKREPAKKVFNVYSGIDTTPTPVGPGKDQSWFAALVGVLCKGAVGKETLTARSFGAIPEHEFSK